MNTHAQREFDILSETVPDAIILRFKDQILSLCEAFHKSGQSGGSAPIVATMLSQAVKKLMMFETITPLTGEAEEWNDATVLNGHTLYQNNRDSRVFKDSESGKARFVEAIVFKEDIGGSFTGTALHNGQRIYSQQTIKNFPFTPKTFYVDVIAHRWRDQEEQIPDVNGHWWTHTIKDPEQLKEVFEYYDQYEIGNLR